MRLIPLLTAILVMATLFAVVFERERLLAFARGETEVSAPADTAAAPAPAPDTPLTDAAIDEAVAMVDGPGVGVVAVTSEARTVDSAVVLRGQTQAHRQVEVRAETSAIVVSEPLRKGASVAAGDLLCRLDTGTREASVAEARARLSEAQSREPEARARLEEARARVEEAQVNWNAANQLAKGGYASETRLKSAWAQVQSAQAGVAAALAGLEATQAGVEAAAAGVALAEREIDRLTITAPFDGLLESDAAELGSLMQPGSLCATVIQLNPIMLAGYVPETEVGRVEVGALAGARLASGREVQGRVTFLSRSADPTTRTFLVEIEVDNSDLSIRDGQTAEILISAAGTQAHFLPQSALTLNNEGQLGVRIVDEDSMVAFVAVELLRDQVDGVWVAGLPQTADVIVVGQDFVTQGVRVAPTYREASR